MQNSIKYALAFFLLVGPTLTQAQTFEKDEAAISQIVEDFKQSIIEKDKEKFMQLFEHDSIPWIGVLSDKTLELMKARMPGAAKLYESSYTQFINSIVGTPAKLEEKFLNVRIMCDNLIGSVHFDYGFFANDNVQNWGQEAWHMIKTENGWKISSVTYSVIMPQDKPYPFGD